MKNIPSERFPLGLYPTRKTFQAAVHEAARSYSSRSSSSIGNPWRQFAKQQFMRQHVATVHEATVQEATLGDSSRGSSSKVQQSTIAQYVAKLLWLNLVGHKVKQLGKFKNPSKLQVRGQKFMKVWHQCWRIRQPALLSKLRSSAQGLLRLLSATAAKSISGVKPSSKRDAHHAHQKPVYLGKESPIFSSRCP